MSIDGVIYAPEVLKPLELELKAMHKIREIRFGRPTGSYEVLDESLPVYLVK